MPTMQEQSSRERLTRIQTKLGAQPGLWGSLSTQARKHKGARQGWAHGNCSTMSELELQQEYLTAQSPNPEPELYHP